MERETLKNGMRLRFDERQRIMFDRNEEYAEEKDALADFRRIALICKIWKVDVTKPEDCAFFYRIAKMDRQRNLRLQGKKADDPQFVDTCIDDANYFDLYVALVEEEHGGSSMD